MTSILAPLIRMMNQRPAWPSAQDSHVQGIHHQPLSHLSVHRPADDPSRIKIHHNRQMHPARSRPENRHVGSPNPIRLGHMKSPLHQVIGCCRRFVRPLPFHTAVRLRHNPVFPHQARYPLAAQAKALAPQCHVNPGGAIDLPVFQKDRPNLPQQQLISLAPKARSSFLPGVVTGPRHPQNFAHRLYSEFSFVSPDEPETIEASFAKKIRLFFKISRSSRKRLFSRRKVSNSSWGVL